jgi:hypothetical protein
MIVCCIVALLIGAALNTGIAGEPSPPDATIADLAWLTGYWMSNKRNTITEECWLPPSGGVMLGLHRDVSADGDVIFEYLRIVETTDGLVYYATPRGIDTTKFTLTSLTSDGSSRQAVFENPEHDNPNLIRYTLSDDGLMAEVEGIDDDHTVVDVWVWNRAEFPQNTTR